MANTTFGGLYAQAKASGAFNNVLPEGDFVLRIVGGNGSFKDNGEPKIGLQIEVVRSDVEEDIGKKAWINLSFTEKAAPISYRQLRAFGLSDEFIEAAQTPDEVAKALIGVEADTEVTIRKWGKNSENESNNVKVVDLLVPPAVGAVDPQPPVSDPEEDEEPF